MNSAPFSYASTGVWTTTRGMPGMTPRMMSSSDGFVAEVMATESPSQPRPAVIQMTCAVTASVAFWLGTNSMAAIRDSFRRLADRPGQWIADQQVHHAAAAERGLDEHHPRGIGLDLADLRRGLAAGRRAQRGQRGVRGLGRDEGDEHALVRDVHGVDAEDLARAGDRRAAPAPPPRARPSRRRGVRELVEHRGDAAARRVAQAAQRRAGGVEQRVDGRPERAGVGLDRGLELELAAREHDRRAVLADRARDEDPVARRSGRRRELRAPGIERRARWSSRTSSRSGRARRPSCRRRRSRRPPLPRPRRSPRPRRAARPRAEPSSSTQRERQRQRARAGHGEVVDRAVDRELADRAAGEADRLDDEAVGREREPVDAPGVAQLLQASLPKAGTKQPLDQGLRRLAAGAVRHRDLRVAEARAAAARTRSIRARASCSRVSVAHTTSRSRAKRPKL